MKTLKGHIAVGLLVVLLVSQLTIPARARNQSPADRIRASGLFYYFVGRLLLNPSNGTVTVVGYFTDLEGIAGPLFDGAPSEATAYFTFRSDVFSSQSLPTNIDMAISLGNPGTYTIYLQPSSQRKLEQSRQLFERASRSDFSKDYGQHPHRWTGEHSDLLVYPGVQLRLHV